MAIPISPAVVRYEEIEDSVVAVNYFHWELSRAVPDTQSGRHRTTAVLEIEQASPVARPIGVFDKQVKSSASVDLQKIHFAEK